MSLIRLIHMYGYLAILIGCFLEGETILILGGIAAEQGYLALPGVIAAAFVGSLTGDQLFFHIGRKFGPEFIERKPRLKKAQLRLQKWINGHEIALVLGFRFLYGLRTAAPFVFGTTTIKRGRFALWNAVGALVWATAVGYAGFLAGHAFATFLAHFERYELLLLVLAAMAAGLWLWSRYRS